MNPAESNLSPPVLPQPINRKREFRLPLVSELSRDQEAVLRLPIKGKFLVVGAPGTGKSVLAVQRAIALHHQKISCMVLVYNRALAKSIEQMTNNKGVAIKTVNSWAREMCKLYFKINKPPEISRYIIDWRAFLQMVRQLKKDDADALATYQKQLPYLVIDEGQDMSPDFYAFLHAFGFSNVWVAADQNQILGEHNSTLQDILDNLEVDDKLELTQNHRNTQAVGRYAETFYNDPSSPKPTLQTKLSTRRPILYFHNNAYQDALIRRVLEYANEHPTRLIGVFCYTTQTRDALFDRLKQYNHALADPVPISIVEGHLELDFKTGGVMVMCVQACKGLEFETVLTFNLEQFHYTDAVAAKKNLYVLSTRCKDQLVLLADFEAFNKKYQVNKTVFRLQPRSSDLLEVKTQKALDCTITLASFD